MKTVLALGALAALFQSALTLQAGTYRIGSASLAENKVLTDEAQDAPIVFADTANNPYQTWFFNAATGGSERDFVIENLSGGYINCGAEPGSPCVSGDEEEVYTAEQVSDNGYELVAQKSRYFLRADGEDLQLAEYDNSPNEEFILTPV